MNALTSLLQLDTLSIIDQPNAGHVNIGMMFAKQVMFYRQFISDPKVAHLHDEARVQLAHAEQYVVLHANAIIANNMEAMA